MNKVFVVLTVYLMSLNLASAGLFGLSPTEKLIKAVEQGDVNRVKKYINKGANVNAKLPFLKLDKSPNKTMITLLQFTATYGTSEMASALINGGAYLETDNRIDPPFLSAAMEGKVDMMHLLLSRGANADARGWDGRNALHRATSMGQFESVMFLLRETTLNVDSSDNNGNTPLMVVSQISPDRFNKKRRAYLDIAAALLEAGANVNKRITFVENGARTEKTALGLAKYYNRHDLQDILLKYDASEYDANEFLNQKFQIERQEKQEKLEKEERDREFQLKREAMARANNSQQKPTNDLQRATQIFNLMGSAAKTFQSLDAL